VGEGALGVPPGAAYTPCVVRSLVLRVFAFVLAGLPVVWGTCPRWIAGDGFSCSLCASGGEAAPGDAPRCPCCASKTKHRGAPSDRRNDSCPVLEVRHTMTPAPADVTVPPLDTTVVAFDVATAPGLDLLCRGPLVPRVDPSGGSPPLSALLGTVVLLI
jgi:hypothetical protein